MAARNRFVVLFGISLAILNSHVMAVGDSACLLFRQVVPQSLQMSVLAFDAEHRSIVAFGRPSYKQYGNMTWEWDRSTWTRHNVLEPPERMGHAMLYDRHRKVMVLFGGQGLGHFLGDTWEWDGDGWTMKSDTGPAPRGWHAMAYDEERGVTVLFGGITVQEGLLQYFDDTWEWDGASWTQRIAIGPSPRRYHAMVYDASASRVLLYGGIGGNVSTGMLGDTWEWDGATWILRASDGPSPRYVHTMAYDRTRRVTTLFGGMTPTCESNVAKGCLNDETWEWDGIGWTRRDVEPPDAMIAIPKMLFDEQRQTTLLFGQSWSSWKEGIWKWDGTSWATLLDLTPKPAGSGGSQMVYDPAQSKTLFLGSGLWAWNGATWIRRATDGPGSDCCEPIVFDGFRNVAVTHSNGETWGWDGMVWNFLATDGPSPRSYHAMAFDFTRGVTVLFGGYSSTLGYLYDTWEWDGAVWALRTTTGPKPQRMHKMWYDALRHETMLLGGQTQGGSSLDFMSWDGTNWRSLGIEPPISGTYGSISYDNDRKVALLIASIAAEKQGAWEWDGAAWKSRPASLPSLNNGFSLAYDDSRDTVVLDGELGTWEVSVTDVLPDVDRDCDVDLADFAVLQNCWGMGINSDGCATSDVDGNGTVSIEDYLVFKTKMEGPQY